MRLKIICIGNRFHPQDSSGPRIFDQLQTRQLPEQVQLIDGGLGGLNLLGCLEEADKVIFVDSVTGFLPNGGTTIVDNPIEHLHVDDDFNHDAGLGYLLRIAPMVLDGPMPKVTLLGVEGNMSEKQCEEAVQLCLSLIT